MVFYLSSATYGSNIAVCLSKSISHPVRGAIQVVAIATVAINYAIQYTSIILLWDFDSYLHVTEAGKHCQIGPKNDKWDGSYIYIYIFIYLFIYLLQLGCYPVAVVILHVNKTWNWLQINLSREGLESWEPSHHLLIEQGNQEKSVSRWPVAGPSEYWLLASSPAYKVKKKKQQCTHSTTNTHKMTTIHTRQLRQYTQNYYNNTHGQPTTITHKTT